MEFCDNNIAFERGAFMRLQEKIVSLRKQKGWSQEELAGKLNVSRQSISRWEVGSAQPDANNIVQLSKLFGITADYLLNEDFESDYDLPVVKSVNDEANHKLSRIIALSITFIGLLGNAIIYILSRAIEVMIPFVTYENGKKIYEWKPDFTGRSYKYFIQEYNLELLAIVFWILLIAGVIMLIIPKKKLIFIREKLGSLKKEKSKTEQNKY